MIVCVQKIPWMRNVNSAAIIALRNDQSPRYKIVINFPCAEVNVLISLITLSRGLTAYSPLVLNSASRTLRLGGFYLKPRISNNLSLKMAHHTGFRDRNIHLPLSL